LSSPPGFLRWWAGIEIWVLLWTPLGALRRSSTAKSPQETQARNSTPLAKIAFPRKERSEIEAWQKQDRGFEKDRSDEET